MPRRELGRGVGISRLVHSNMTIIATRPLQQPAIGGSNRQRSRQMHESRYKEPTECTHVRSEVPRITDSVTVGSQCCSSKGRALRVVSDRTICSVLFCITRRRPVMAMLAALAAVALAMASMPVAVSGERVSIPFRYGWRFHYGPGPDDGA